MPGRACDTLATGRQLPTPILIVMSSLMSVARAVNSRRLAVVAAAMVLLSNLWGTAAAAIMASVAKIVIMVACHSIY